MLYFQSTFDQYNWSSKPFLFLGNLRAWHPGQPWPTWKNTWMLGCHLESHFYMTLPSSIVLFLFFILPVSLLFPCSANQCTYLSVCVLTIQYITGKLTVNCFYNEERLRSLSIILHIAGNIKEEREWWRRSNRLNFPGLGRVISDIILPKIMLLPRIRSEDAFEILAADIFIMRLLWWWRWVD